MRTTVYPRVCGGTRNNAPTWGTIAGLSPRVRGNLHRPDPACEERGSIPACAGEPSIALAPSAPLRFNPRVCGGTLSSVAPATTSTGLSPRVRGNRPPPLACQLFPGSIPACAGEPPRPHPRCPRRRVYPRVCGGTELSKSRVLFQMGLSPRVRGNLLPVGRSLGRSRSIPACAGEPAARHGGGGRSRVYPRVCGGTTSRR